MVEERSVKQTSPRFGKEITRKDEVSRWMPSDSEPYLAVSANEQIRFPLPTKIVGDARVIVKKDLAPEEYKFLEHTKQVAEKEDDPKWKARLQEEVEKIKKHTELTGKRGKIEVSQEWVPGKPLNSAGYPFLFENRHKILGQVADILADFFLAGTYHGHIHSGNMKIEETDEHPDGFRIWLVDPKRMGFIQGYMPFSKPDELDDIGRWERWYDMFDLSPGGRLLRAELLLDAYKGDDYEERQQKDDDLHKEFNKAWVKAFEDSVNRKLAERSEQIAKEGGRYTKVEFADEVARQERERKKRESKTE